METCVLPQSLQVTTTNEQGTELGSKGLTLQHQDNASTTDTKANTSRAIINNRKSSSASLSDLIPAAAAALRTRQELQRNQQQQQTSKVDNKTSSPHSTAISQDSTLYYRQQQAATTATNSTPFARALTKVKLQVQTKRLKERYLSHEWIRLALGLPVDLSRINLHHCYYLREQADNVGKQRKSTQQPKEKTDDTMTPAPTPALSSTSSPPSPAPSNTSTSLLDMDNHYQQQDINQMEIQPPTDRKSTTTSSNLAVGRSASTTTPPASPSSSRTGEIATWYEWKFDRSKFSVEEVEGKVDRLRTTKIRDKLASPP